MLATRIGCLLTSLGLIAALSCGDTSASPAQSPGAEVIAVPTTDLRPAIETAVANALAEERVNRPVSSPIDVPTESHAGAPTPNLVPTVEALIREALDKGVVDTPTPRPTPVPPTVTPTIVPTPTPVPVTPTPPGPDLEATVQALEVRVEALTAHVPTVEALSAYVPTIEDYKVVAIPKVPSYSPVLRDAAIRDFYRYAAVYSASECVAGREPTSKAFRLYVDQSYGTLNDLVVVEVIRNVIANSKRGGEPAACMRPYLYPEGIEEAALAIDLVKSLRLPGVVPSWRDAVERAYDSEGYQWLRGGGEGMPFLPWLCEQDYFGPLCEGN